MSYEAGGAVLVAPALGAACTAAATVLVGGVVIGAGYMAIKGACRGASTCKNAWESHLSELEAEREKRFAKLKSQDEQRLKSIRESYASLVNASSEFLAEQEKKLKEAIEKEAREKFEAEQKNIQRQATLKKMEMIDAELKEAAAGSASFTRIMRDQNKQEEYIERLRAKREELKRREQELAGSLDVSVNEKPILSKYDKQNNVMEDLQNRFENIRPRLEALMNYRVNIISFFSITSQEKDMLLEQIADLQNLLKDTAEITPEIEGAISKIKEQFTRYEQKESVYILEREKNVRHYESLQERYYTALLDDSLSKLLERPLDKLNNTLSSVSTRLNIPGGDTGNLAEELNSAEAEFDKSSSLAFESYQTGLNKYVKDSMESVLSDRGYSEITIKSAKDGTVNITACGNEKYKDACFKGSISSQGSMNIDLSHQGFANQTECSREFMAIQAALEKKGIFVDIHRQKSVWITKTVEGLLKKLRNMGYAEKDITLKEHKGNVQLTATRGGTQKKIIEVNARDGIREADTECATEKEKSATEILKAREVRKNVHSQKVEVRS